MAKQINEWCFLTAWHRIDKLLFYFMKSPFMVPNNRKQVEVGPNEYTMEKVDYDPACKTIQFVRLTRMKNENLHAALKQKYQQQDSVLELPWPTLPQIRMQMFLS